jgi:hypothetical protein
MSITRWVAARWAPQVRPLCRHWHAWAQRLGMPGRLGLCLCCLALVVWVGALPVQHRQVDELAAHNDWLHQRLAALSAPDTATEGAPQGGSAAAGDARALWTQVWQALPWTTEAGTRQASLLRAAADQVSEPVSFTHERVTALPGLTRWRLSVSTTAPWSQQMQWMTHVLAQPAVSIDAVHLQREQPHDAVWHLRLGLSLWTRDPVAAGPAVAPTTTPLMPQAVAAPVATKEQP